MTPPPARSPRGGRRKALPAEPAPAPHAPQVPPMRIVVRVHSWPPYHNAGSELMTVALLDALVARGHQCSVWLSRYGPVREPYDLGGVQVVPFTARLDYGAAVRDADVIISYWENVPSAGALARSFGRPFVVICHNASQQVLRNAGVASAALVVYNSLWVRAEAEAFYSEYAKAQVPDRSLVVRPPVVADDYRTEPGDAVTLINLCADKGGHLFWKLAERFPDRQFLGVRGAYGQQIIRDLPNVEIVDHVPADRMRDEVYARTRVLLMPSVHESWGRAGIEAMCSGIPVIANPTPGLSESLADAGLFAEVGDFNGWVSTLEALDDPAEWAAASQRALDRAKELDPSADLAAWCDAIESLPRKG